jgi:CarD family transcriptional regulator
LPGTTFANQGFEHIVANRVSTSERTTSTKKRAESRHVKPEVSAPTKRRGAEPAATSRAAESKSAASKTSVSESKAREPAPEATPKVGNSAAATAEARSHKGDGMSMGTEVQFKVGDKAVYPAQGVAEVVSIEEKDIAGARQRFYVLRILDTDRKIMVPVMNAKAVGLRGVISEEEIREIFDILRERTIAFDNQTWNRRYRGFMDKIKTGSIYDVAEVMRDLYRLKTDKQLSFGERRMLDTARTLIVKEIAIARSQTEEQVRTEIEAIFLSN